MPYNFAMSHLDILVPFGLPPAELARDIVRALQAPALSALLSYGQETATSDEPAAPATDGFARSLPHERWLAHAFGLSGDFMQSSPPVAPALLRRFAPETADGFWFLLQPVHLHVALDHLVLTDPRQLTLSDAEARALFDAARPIFADAGMTLRYGDASTWLLCADAWRGLATATPDSACGRNIDIWMPQGDAALAWRKLQNEVQMTWFAHPLHEEWMAQGRKPANSLWLWGGGAMAFPEGASRFDAVVNLDGPLQALAPASIRVAQPDELLAAPFRTPLLVLDELAPAALAGDWGTWIEAMQRLDTQWFAPLLDGLKRGRPGSLSLRLGDGARLRQWQCRRLALRKFWVKPTLAEIAA